MTNKIRLALNGYRQVFDYNDYVIEMFHKNDELFVVVNNKDSVVDIMSFYDNEYTAEEINDLIYSQLKRLNGYSL